MASRAATLDLPPWRVTFQIARGAVERSAAACHASGSRPTCCASCTGSSAVARSSASVLIRRLQCAQAGRDGGAGVGIWRQRREQGGPHGQPFGADEHVYGGPAVELALDLEQQLQAGARLAHAQ